MRHTYASGLFGGEKDQSERNVMYAHLDVLSARSKAVKRRVSIHIKLHDQLVNDLKGEHDETISR